jgi:hypothetical protein
LGRNMLMSSWIASHSLKSKENSDIVLFPQPTDDPNDPLNWPRWKKNLALVTASYLSMAAGWYIGGLGPGVPLLIAEFGTDLNTTINGVINWAVLVLGLGVMNHNLFWAECFNRSLSEFRQRCISEHVPLYCSPRFCSLSHQFGVPLPIASIA